MQEEVWKGINRMSDKNKENLPESASDFEFLQEKIKERPINKKKLLRRTVITASLAVLFGLLACLSFLLLEPVLNNWLYPEEEPAEVTFPPEQNEMLPEDMLTEGTTTSQETETSGEESQLESATSEESQSSIRESHTIPATESAQVEDAEQENKSENLSETSEESEQQEIDGTNEGISEAIDLLKLYQAQYDALFNVYQDVSSSMVTVTALHSDVDWFNNTYQSEGTTAGVIIANNNKELLILSRKSPLDDAESIKVSFGNEVDADAQMKQYDKNTDLAVLAVDLKFIKSETLDYVTVAELGSSTYSGIAGTPVIAMGNLFGYKDTVCYGMVTSKGNTISMADNEYQLITTDIYAGTTPSGILVNMDKEVIGIIDNSHNHSDTQNLLSAIGITELKGIIAKLSNGEDIPYLGIYTQDITDQTRMELGIPQGAYIFDIDMDSPAMLNGIQKGDILVQIGSQEVSSTAEYMNALRNASTERSIRIIVQRASLDSYEEMQFTVQPVKKE